MATYIIPTIPTVNDFGNVRYINPSASAGGNGSESTPFNALPATLERNTAYLFKVGETLPNLRITSKMDANYFGAYGTGPRPVIGQGFQIADLSHNLVIRDLELRKDNIQPNGMDFIINGLGTNNSNWNVANCRIQGNYRAVSTYTKVVTLPNNVVVNVPVHYPDRAVRIGNVNGLTIYHNEIRDVHDDGIWLSSCPNLKIVKNWIFDINRGGYQQSTDTVYHVGGDCIQMEYQYLNFYIAGNILDKSLTDWKFAFLTKSGWLSTNRGGIFEHNTLYGGKSGYGGGVLYWDAPQETILRKNVIDATNKGLHSGGVVPIYLPNYSIAHLNQADPYGVTSNHLIKLASQSKYIEPAHLNLDQYADESNVLHNGWAAYESYKTANPSNDWGSDIDTDNFLSENVNSPIIVPSIAINIEIIGGGTVTKNPDKELYLPGESVEFTATPNEGKAFGGWGGAVVSSENPVTIIAS